MGQGQAEILVHYRLSDYLDSGYIALQIRVRMGATPPSLSVPREALPEYMKSSAVDFAGIDVGVYSVLPGHPVTVPLEFSQFLRWSVRVSAANITALA
jgi:hypothetical protein